MGCRKLVLSTASIQGEAVAMYRASGYRQVREEVADAASNKTVGGGMTRYHFEAMLLPDDAIEPPARHPDRGIGPAS